MKPSSGSSRKLSSRKLKRPFVIVIDGPAASGKSTAAYLLAKKLGFVYMDTGAMYRALTWKALKNQIDLKDEEALSKMAMSAQINISPQNNSPGVIVNLDGEDVSALLRTPEINSWVSVVSRIFGVRRAMLELQREIAKESSVVAEGRDMGTVVFPQADVKIFLSASLKERTKRRWKEVRDKQINCTEDDVREELKMRDKIDSERDIAPLKKASDAILVDNTHLNIRETVEKVFTIVKEKIKLTNQSQ
ncbi:(d)CMP kinase [Candidatus Aerophobetes bacterium]|nr:(d)CMP kinase [Candidatus Aerophobetes bacterium]